MYYQAAPMHQQRGDFMAHQAASFDSRKRGFDDLNDFFGNVKRRQIDPTSYGQVGRSLMPLHTALGVGSGGLATEYLPASVPQVAIPSMGAGGNPQYYALPPMPNVRTKGDLEQIDHILSQMQGTVYENVSSPSTAHFPHSHGVDVRQHSPSYPVTRPGMEHYAVSAAQVPSPLTVMSSASSHGTPAVTPPSSSMSYTSGHSPTASSAGLSPSSRHDSTASVTYPSLPAVSYPGQSTTSTLGTNFSGVERRMSGGMLQAANEGSRHRDESGTASTPRASESTMSPTPSSDDSEGSSEAESYDDWLQNMRIIESLRKYVQDRLARRDYSRDDDSRIDPMVLDPPAKAGEGKPMYPVLRPIA
jgi:hypothetical protein